jgi:hypothetical protein
MDATDQRILAELQKDGRLTVTELAERIGLSVSPCHRRVRIHPARRAAADLDPGDEGRGDRPAAAVERALRHPR